MNQLRPFSNNSAVVENLRGSYSRHDDVSRQRLDGGTGNGLDDFECMPDDALHIDFFSDVTEPISSKHPDFFFGNNSASVPSAVQKSRAIATCAFDLSAFVIRRAHPRADFGNDARAPRGFCRYEKTCVTHHQIAVSGAGTYGNPK